MRSLTGIRPSFKSNTSIGKAARSVFKNVDTNSIKNTNAINTSSFSIDHDNSGLRSTQELPIDYTSFENHTFFNSARAKVDIAFNEIINYFPYDKNRAQIEDFLNSLTGFEKYVYDNFPKNVGYLNFSGNSYVTIRDGKSLNFSQLNTTDVGLAVLDPLRSPFSIEAQIIIPEVVNGNQVIAQRISNTSGISLVLSQSSSTTQCNVVFLVSSASESYVVSSGSINKGSWVHLCAQLEDTNGSKEAVIYINQDTVYRSPDSQDFDSLTFEGESLIIGSGSKHEILDYTFLPTAPFSGSIDEFRYFKSSRSISDLRAYAKREVYPDENSKLTAYLKFNEPSGSFAGKNYALDSSGNQLHSLITNFSDALRITGSYASPLIYENINYSPNLYANQADVVALNTQLLSDAESFDYDNPNFILKLIPPHYLEQGAQLEGLNYYDQNLGNQYLSTSIPGTGILPKPQMMITFLLTYAKFYDELKLMIDYFSHVNYVELDDNESAIDKFLPFVASYYGLELPNFFSNSTPDQFFYGQTLGNDYSISQRSLKSVRYQIWRRILGNITELIQAKGTRSSIRSAILSTGIIPENFFNIREYGGPAIVDLKGLREKTQERSTLVDFSGSIGLTPTTPNSQGVFSNMPFLISPYLSSSRIEPGIPKIAGNFNALGQSDNKNDGLFTSGSFAIESIVKFPPSQSRKAEQSIFRLQTTGSLLPASSAACLMNLVYDDNNRKLSLNVKSSKESAAIPLDLSITDVNMFNGEKWYIVAGRERGDLISSVQSRYYLRCGYMEDQTSYVYFATSSYFSETLAGDSSQDMFQNIFADYNASGSFLTIGSQSLDTTAMFLNNTANQTNFDGRIGHIRFWSKEINNTESLEHLRNFRSLGVVDPKINFNFDTESSGTFQRLRIDASTDQGTTGSSSTGAFNIFDFTQNNLHLAGSGFESSKATLKNETFYINRISPNIDLMQTDEKVRVRSLINPLETDSYTSIAPVYQLGPETAINDDNRFSVEFSAYKALNEDMISLIGDTQFLDDALGQPSLMFDEIYPDLEKVSKVYFERLTGPVDVRRYLELFKWFDSSLTVLIAQLLPRKTKFMGVNFVIESHLLERNKFRYPIDRMYLLNERPKDTSNIYLSLLTANLKRY